MCGIAGFILKDPSVKIDREALLDALLRGIDHRGGDATGFVARNREGIVEWQKASCDAADFIPFRRRLPLDADVVLAHTRWATQGNKAFPENNHPVKRGPMFVIHNGVIYNDGQLFRATRRNPYGQVDSEAIAALLAHVGKLDESTGAAFADIDGSAAIAALDERDGTTMLARISQSPLWVLTTRRVVMFASTQKAVHDAHKAVIGSLGRNKAVPYQDGDGLVVRDGDARRFTFEPPVSYSWLSSWESGKKDGKTGSYLPATTNEVTATLARPKGDGTPRCELCAEVLDDAYDLWDANDVYEVCGPCWDAYCDPRDRNLGTVTL